MEANPDDCAFQLLIEKDGRLVESTADPGEKAADQAYAGTLCFTPDTPSGIASELRTASVDGGTSYRGTFSPLGLKSGEGDGSREHHVQP